MSWEEKGNPAKPKIITGQSALKIQNKPSAKNMDFSYIHMCLADFLSANSADKVIMCKYNPECVAQLCISGTVCLIRTT